MNQTYFPTPGFIPYWPNPCCRCPYCGMHFPPASPQPGWWYSANQGAIPMTMSTSGNSINANQGMLQ